jgi:Carboxypeptidase regulatory-like domain
MRSHASNSFARLLPVLLAIALFLFSRSLAVADEEALLNFVVLRDYNGKPIRNASVVLHPVDNHGKQARGGYELKTDSDGKASFDGVPYGKLRIQVLAPGFQTYGDDYDINQPDMKITVKLKRPTGQYSIYSDQQNTPKDQSKPEPKSQ